MKVAPPSTACQLATPSNHNGFKRQVTRTVACGRGSRASSHVNKHDEDREPCKLRSVVADVKPAGRVAADGEQTAVELSERPGLLDRADPHAVEAHGALRHQPPGLAAGLRQPGLGQQRDHPHAAVLAHRGGGNLERDLATVCRLADEHGTDAGVVRSWAADSRHRRDWPLAQLHERVLSRVPDPTLAILGLAYKEDTASTKNSPSLALLEALGPFPIRVYDPAVPARPDYHPWLIGTASALDACAGADALVIMTPWREFRDLRPADVAARLRGRTVIDPYGVLATEACRAAGLHHAVLGRAAA